MFPLQLLALVFISSTAPETPPEEEEEEEKKQKFDLMFRRGDLLEVPRTLFTHFGIYLGGGRGTSKGGLRGDLATPKNLIAPLRQVAHFIRDILPVVSGDTVLIKQIVTNTQLILGVLAKCGSVRVDSVEDFAYGAEILVNPMDKVLSDRVK